MMPDWRDVADELAMALTTLGSHLGGSGYCSLDARSHAALGRFHEAWRADTPRAGVSPVATWEDSRHIQAQARAVVDFAAMDTALADPKRLPYPAANGDLNDAYLRGVAHARVAMLILVGRLPIPAEDYE